MSDHQAAEQIVGRAQREVATRSATHAGGPPGHESSWLSPALVLAALVAFIAMPGALPQKLLWLMGGVCGLRPAHSYFAGGVQLPLESRMVGIYAGFSLSLMVLLTCRRGGARRLARWPTVVLLTLFFGSMAFDGINSTVYEFGGPFLYAPSNLGRLITGLLAGTAMAPALLWIVNLAAAPLDDGNERLVVRSVWELAPLLALNGLLGAMVLSGQPFGYYPIALLSVGGIVATMALAVLLVLVAAGPLSNRVTHSRQLVSPGALAVLVALAVLLVLAAGRWSAVAVV